MNSIFSFEPSKQRFLGVVLQYMQMALNIVISLVYTPVMLRVLGQNEYGIFNLASSTISYLNLLALGFGASYVRYYTRCKKNEEDNSVARLNGLFLVVFFIIGVVAIIAGGFLTLNVNCFFNESYTTEEVDIARKLMIVLTMNMAISFPASVFMSYITSQEKFIFQKIMNLIKSVLGPIANIIFLLLGFGSVGMVVAAFLIAVIVDTINVYVCLKILRMKISFKKLDFLLLKDIFHFSIFIAINQIIDQINWQTDKIILGKIINGTAVAVYAVGANLNTMFTSFSTAISSVFTPEINRIVYKNKDDTNVELTNLFIKVGRIQWFLLSLLLIGFACFGKYFVCKWAGDTYLKSYYVALLLMTPAIVPLIQNIGIEIQRAKYKHRFRSIVYLIMALFNVGISIGFATMWGELGAALGTTISLFLANGIIMNIYYHNRCGIDIIKFWKSILSTIPAFVVPISVGFLMNRFWRFRSLVDFSFAVFYFVIIYSASIYLFGLNKEEKIKIIDYLTKLKKQNSKR